MKVIVIILAIIILLYIISNNISKNKQKDNYKKQNENRKETIIQTPIKKTSGIGESSSQLLRNKQTPFIHSQKNKENLFQEYSDSRWKEKCKNILVRDNFTCQCCQKMNPSKAPIFKQIKINGTSSYYEIHEYDMLRGCYSIYSSYSGLK